MHLSAKGQKVANGNMKDLVPFNLPLVAEVPNATLCFPVSRESCQLELHDLDEDDDSDYGSDYEFS